MQSADCQVLLIVEPLLHFAVPFVSLRTVGVDLRKATFASLIALTPDLEESGPKKQTELAEEFGLEEYAMSRLLARLGLHRYIARRRKGTDKLVSLVRAIEIVQGNDS